MRFHHRILRGSIFILFWLNARQSYPQNADVQLEIISSTSVDFSADQSSFTLSFSSFTSGATTDSVSVAYSVMANDVVRSDDVVLARLSELFPGIAFEAQFDSFTKNGGNATLTPSASGSVTITTEDVGLADKVVDEGDGKLVDGSFVIRYQAKAIEDQAAGEHIRTLTITFEDT